MKGCCVTQRNGRKCRRKDGKQFSLPRRFTLKQCKKPRGFTMRASCAPYKYCFKKTKKTKKTKKRGTLK